jgi:carbonic anhydrase
MSPNFEQSPLHERSGEDQMTALTATLTSSRRVGVSLVLLLAATSNAAAWERSLSVDAGKDGEQWTYQGERGPAHWGELAPEYALCAEGSSQSPIAIQSAGAIAAPCEPLRFRYRSGSLYATNDGKALRLGYDRGSYLVIDGLSYELVELRFHVPAEHVIDGRVADAELQLIHGNNRGDIAVVSVPIEAGMRPNRIFKRILEHAPTVPGESYYGRNVGVNPIFLLPTRKDYFAYVGSLTRPPCTEGVRWYVMRHPLEVDSGDLRYLAQLVGPNARPPQPLEGRRITQICDQ